MSVSSLKQLAYPVYEARLARLIKGKPQPKHIAGGRARLVLPISATVTAKARRKLER